eukprot:CAMPEP_0119101246 /NCGR_PEP_ID=MMETSP1180-20130426/345_1 /TAXON_ID=3052 ORGANISM="Chlamydomonas cf sp, Strain CCMP681" /NCGR_SAMPLE_ID=MMETSP1180 /ASSEMBLY_ACC=CAM_ASM_000741 /LENGTH=158 /DNA_ID=CAMNT_0007085337 /DNA_START=567 /DNA_END=1039 /DNA_ORIENTATION=-
MTEESRVKAPTPASGRASALRVAPIKKHASAPAKVAAPYGSVMQKSCSTACPAWLLLSDDDGAGLEAAARVLNWAPRMGTACRALLSWVRSLRSIAETVGCLRAGAALGTDRRRWGQRDIGVLLLSVLTLEEHAITELAIPLMQELLFVGCLCCLQIP